MVILWALWRSGMTPPGQQQQWSQASLKRVTCMSASSMTPSWSNIGALQVRKCASGLLLGFGFDFDLQRALVIHFSCLTLIMHPTYMPAHWCTSQELPL